MLTEDMEKEVTKILKSEIERLGGIDKVRNLPINDVLTELLGNLLSQLFDRGLIEHKIDLLQMEIFKRERK